MMNSLAIFNFTGVYESESFYREDKGSSLCACLLDLKDLQGTNCFCDDLARQEIRKLIAEKGIDAHGVHFIDNGNYHYMSAIMLEEVKEPFTLIVLDHHPDMQVPMFGDILSCGGWVLDAIEKNEFLRDIHVIGADRGLVEKLEEDVQKRAAFHYGPEGRDDWHIFEELPESELPVYLSIDKDVLSRDELVTNWDQGEMTRKQMFDFVKELLKKRRVIGIDICGECAPDQEGISVEAEIKRNDEFNIQLLNILK